MSNDRRINQPQCEDAAALLSQLFEFDSDIERQINMYLQKYGIVCFFENLEEFELDVDTIIKLQAIRDVLFGLGIAEDRRLKDGAANNA